MKFILALLILCLPLTLPAEKAAGDKEKAGRIEKRLRLANELEAQGDQAGALKILGELTDADPDNAELLERVASLLMQSEQYKEAIPRLKKLLELREGSPAEHAALGRMMIEAEELEPAVAFIEEAAVRFPDVADFPFLLTYPFARLERWDDALDAFQKAVDLAKGESAAMLDDRFYFRYAVAHERAGHITEAELIFRKTLELLATGEPNEENITFAATVMNYLAYVWLERDENIVEAGAMAQEAAAMSPESGAIADTLGWYFFKTGNFPRALVELKKAEKLIEEPDPVIFDHLGQTLAKLKEKEFAADYFRKALELDPENEEVKARLSEVAE
jgi:tetratricopeptide (TPR) repeat protein